MTSNHFLLRCLSHFQCPNTLGVFSSDTLPSPHPTTKYAIVNCSPRGTPGSHFVLVRMTPRTFHVFDPLGSLWVRLVPDFQHYAHQHGLRLKSWSFQLQHPSSHFCGLHCLALCLMMAKYRWPLKKIRAFYAPIHVAANPRTFENERRTLSFLSKRI